jgi:hypothetical protein
VVLYTVIVLVKKSQSEYMNCSSRVGAFQIFILTLIVAKKNSAKVVHASFFTVSNFSKSFQTLDFLIFFFKMSSTFLKLAVLIDSDESDRCFRRLWSSGAGRLSIPQGILKVIQSLIDGK